PQAAAHLWPAVAELARESDGRGMYAAASLLRNARECKSEAEYFAVASRVIEAHRREQEF
ncbi:MAG: hypothetical protein ACREHD_10685, partial [Pirellulales bacterium]